MVQMNDEEYEDILKLARNLTRPLTCLYCERGEEFWEDTPCESEFNQYAPKHCAMSHGISHESKLARALLFAEQEKESNRIAARAAIRVVLRGWGSKGEDLVKAEIERIKAEVLFPGSSVLAVTVKR